MNLRPDPAIKRDMTRGWIVLDLSKNMLVVISFLGLTMGISNLAKPVCAAANIAVLSHTGYVDTTGYYHVVGELQNTGDTAADFVQVLVTFYDSGNAQIAERFDLAMLNVLLSQRKSPFDIALLDGTQSALVDHYVVNVTYSDSEAVPMGLQILTNSSRIDELGSMHITGAIQNIGESPTTNVRIVSTYYNETGDVVAASTKNLELENSLAPNQTATFEIVLAGERAQYVTKYELTGESNTYTVIPEISFQPEILFGIITLGVVLIIRPRRGAALKKSNPRCAL
jgi:hypothetical protein